MSNLQNDQLMEQCIEAHAEECDSTKCTSETAESNEMHSCGWCQEDINKRFNNLPEC